MRRGRRSRPSRMKAEPPEWAVSSYRLLSDEEACFQSFTLFLFIIFQYYQRNALVGGLTPPQNRNVKQYSWVLYWRNSWLLSYYSIFFYLFYSISLFPNMPAQCAGGRPHAAPKQKCKTIDIVSKLSWFCAKLLEKRLKAHFSL